MKHKQSPLRSQRQHRGWPLNYDVLCWIGAIALLLLLIGGKQFFGTWLPGTGAMEHPRSIPQRLDLPGTQALAVVKPLRQ
ncbi:hypothetical protein LNN38_13840 [Pseudomonas sp. LA21]|uniref:hypothetical protein n=1 Tax=unclassified Pseudomonas TaxID=196821 RepID=UPI001FB6ADDC|nr:hypothetical protein [Pseudomonas sp. LA21]MCJ1885932.1 hypothetical protein [Pseudomonas sp. LA21]